MLGSYGTSSMKIGSPESGDDLLARMQEAAESARAEKSSASFDSATVSESPQTEGIATDSASSVSSTAPAGPSERINARLKTTAADVLDGRLEDPRKVRGQVVEIVVDEKYADHLSTREKRAITKTLKETLVDDPAFKQEVDTMLMLAAREVAIHGS